MHGLRTRLPRIALFWLCCQIALFAAAPVTFAATATLASSETCECPDAKAGQACPMHAGSSSGADSKTCYMRGTCASLDFALLSLSGGVGELASHITQANDILGARVKHVTVNPVFQPAALDAPPPRN